MKEVLYALANLLHEYSTANDISPEITARLTDNLRLAVHKVPGPRIKRLAAILELMATDAVP